MRSTVLENKYWLGGTVCAKLYVNWKVNSETSWRRWRKSRVAGAGGALYLTARAVKNSPKPILCDPGAFCERRNRRAQLGAKVENPQPPQLQHSVRSRRLGGNEIFLEGFLWGGDFRTWRVFLKLFLKIICRLRGPHGLCVLDKKL